MIQGILYFNLPVKEMMKNMIEMLSLNVDGI